MVPSLYALQNDIYSRAEGFEINILHTKTIFGEVFVCSLCRNVILILLLNLNSTGTL